MTKQEEVRKVIRDILFEDLIICGITHEHAPPTKDCLSDCDVLNGNDGMPLGEHGKTKHKRCMDCWEGYVDGLVAKIQKREASKGVVIKVERISPEEMPKPCCLRAATKLGVFYSTQLGMLEAGYTAVEEL